LEAACPKGKTDSCFFYPPPDGRKRHYFLAGKSIPEDFDKGANRPAFLAGSIRGFASAPESRLFHQYFLPGSFAFPAGASRPLPLFSLITQ
jgi:hypothetical protein